MEETKKEKKKMKIINQLRIIYFVCIVLAIVIPSLWFIWIRDGIVKNNQNIHDFISKIIHKEISNDIVINFINNVLDPIVIILTVYMCIGVIICIVLVLLSRKNNYKLKGSFYSLSSWVDYNDIGNANNIISALSIDESIDEFFKNKYKDVSKNIDETSYYRIGIDKNAYLIKEMPSVLNSIDKATKENILYIKKYISFESSKNKTWGKIIEGFFSIAYLTILGTVFKYGIDCYFDVEKRDLGLLIMWGIGSLFIISIGFGIKAYFDMQKEKNARNFLNFVFSVID